MIVQLITAALFVVVCLAFALALYARHRMTAEDPRPGYIFDQEEH